MQTSVFGHHHQISDATRQHIDEGIAKLEKYYSPVLECNVTITKDSDLYRVDLIAKVHGQTLKSSDDGDRLFPVIDGAMDKMARQLKKLHDKRRRPRGAVPPVSDEPEE